MATSKDTITLTFSGRTIKSDVKDIPLYQAVVTRVKILQSKNQHLQDILDSFQAALDFGGFGMSIDINDRNLFEALAIAKSTGTFPDISKFKKTKHVKFSSPTVTGRHTHVPAAATVTRKHTPTATASPPIPPYRKHFRTHTHVPAAATVTRKHTPATAKPAVSSSGVLTMLAAADPSKPSTVRLGLIPTTPSMAAKEFVMWFDIIPKLTEKKLVDDFIKECRLNSIRFDAHDNVPLPKIIYENFMKDKKNKKQDFSFLLPME